jgi:hypothetical protein
MIGRVSVLALLLPVSWVYQCCGSGSSWIAFIWLSWIRIRGIAEAEQENEPKIIKGFCTYVGTGMFYHYLVLT